MITSRENLNATVELVNGSVEKPHQWKYHDMKHPRKAKHIRQKQHEKRLTRWFAAGGTVFVLLAIGGLLYWHSKQTPPEPVTIYKTTPSMRKSDTAETQQIGSLSHIHHPDDQHNHENISPDVSTVPVENVPTDDVALMDSDKTSFDLELTDAEVAHEVIHMQLEEIKDHIQALNTEMTEKYPEVAKISYLSPEEVRKRYPTQAAQAVLQEKAEKMREEYLAKISDFMGQLPMDKKIEIIVGVSQNFAEKYGDNAADDITARLMRSFGL